MALCQRAAHLLTSEKRREFQAECACSFCAGSPRRAEEMFGWGRATVALGLQEARGGIVCLGHFAARGGKKMEALTANWKRTSARWLTRTAKPTFQPGHSRLEYRRKSACHPRH